MATEPQELLREWARLGKPPEQSGLAIWPHLHRLRNETEAFLATQGEQDEKAEEEEEGRVLI